MRKSMYTSATLENWGVISVRQAVSGLFRRFTEQSSLGAASSSAKNHTDDFDDARSSRPKGISAFLTSSLNSIKLNYRTYSSQDAARLLTKSIAEEIRLLVPPRLQLCEEWNLIYSLEKDGASLATLYKKCRELDGERNGFVLIVKDGKGDLFGVYLNEAPRIEPHFFGNGECFLWRATFLSESQMKLPLLPSDDTTNMQRSTTVASRSFLSPGSRNSNEIERTKSNTSSSSEPIRFKAFPYSGINDYLILCEAQYLSIGGGDGHYGLWLDDTLERGISSSCLTFGNEPLSEEGEKFDVMGVEVWIIGDNSAI
ncbi:Oxidation resistance protein 1 [Golovinomyces cichoracearum]|uniref:Oxidation resistance protein 1 n=1 Tax=Golovinomyces cichoracearum TaxID=62708 RepID=A0A420IXC4_9PEZI|nr:Oxidation resistance protein 1 [Golovinomyces cichoracearum]